MAGTPKYHDPNAKLDYEFDWSKSNVLTDGDTIVSATVTTTATGTPPIELSAVTHTATAVKVWIAGGSPGQRVSLRCHIVTANGREDDETGVLVVRDL